VFSPRLILSTNIIIKDNWMTKSIENDINYIYEYFIIIMLVIEKKVTISKYKCENKITK